MHSENNLRLHYFETCTVIIKCHYSNWCVIVNRAALLQRHHISFCRQKTQLGPTLFFTIDYCQSDGCWPIFTFLNKAQILAMKCQSMCMCILVVCMHVWVTSMDLQACAIITCWWECKSICKCNSTDWLSPSVIFITRKIQQNYNNTLMKTV